MKLDSQISFNFTGEQLRDTGLQMAVDHAGESWKDITWELFKEFLKTQSEPFMMEEFRSHCAMIDEYELPPSARAFGFLPLKAVREGLIKKIGHKNVSNARAHSCFAALWLRIN